MNFPEQSPRSQALAVVGAIEHAGRVGQLVLVERAQHLADLLVEIGRRAVVGCRHPPHRLLVEALIKTEEAAEVVHSRVLRPGLGRPLRRQRHILDRILRVDFRWRDIGRVRADEIEEDGPGLVVVFVVCQPAQRVLCTTGVVLEIRRVAGTGASQFVFFIAKGRVVPDAAEHVAAAVYHV